jgi:hypothetical protein
MFFDIELPPSGFGKDSEEEFQSQAGPQPEECPVA